MRVPIAVCLAAVAVQGCASPSARFLGETPTTVAVGARSFEVYAAGDAAQAIRTNREWGADAAEVFDDAAAAIEQATACAVDRDSLSGDVVVVSAAIDCNP